MKTYSTRASDIERQWHVLDASGQILGRLATRAARLLMGKDKSIFTRNLDTGDHVVIVNADKIQFTGDKATKKIYYRHTGYPGGLKSVSLEKMMQTNPAWVVEHAIKGMLPHNRLGARMFKKLRIYTGDTHPHVAQIRASSTETSTGEKA